MKKTIFFDIGNVLLYFNHDRMYEQIAKFCQIETKTVHKLLFEEGWGDLCERGEIDSQKLHEHFCSLTQKKLDFQGLMEAMSNIFKPNEDIIPLINELKKQNHNLYVLSNTCEPHFAFAYARFPILKLFDGHVLSYEVKARKPHFKIFETALQTANCEKQSCFYTDDIEEYVNSARFFGIDAEQYVDIKTLRKQLVARGFLK